MNRLVLTFAVLEDLEETRVFELPDVIVEEPVVSVIMLVLVPWEIELNSDEAKPTARRLSLSSVNARSPPANCSSAYTRHMIVSGSSVRSTVAVIDASPEPMIVSGSSVDWTLPKMLHPSSQKEG